MSLHSEYDGSGVGDNDVVSGPGENNRGNVGAAPCGRPFIHWHIIIINGDKTNSVRLVQKCVCRSIVGQCLLGLVNIITANDIQMFF